MFTKSTKNCEKSIVSVLKHNLLSLRTTNGVTRIEDAKIPSLFNHSLFFITMHPIALPRKSNKEIFGDIQ